MRRPLAAFRRARAFLRGAFALLRGAFAPLRRTLGDRRGVALLIALFVITIMAVTVVDFAYFVQIDANVAANNSDDLRAYYLAVSAVRAGAAMLTQSNAISPDSDRLGEPWADATLVINAQLLAQQQGTPLLGVKDGGGFVGKLRADCAPLREAEEEFEEPIVDENRKLSLPGLILDHGGPNERVDYKVFIAMRNLFMNYFQTDAEARGPISSQFSDPTELSQEVMASILDWMDTAAYRSPYPLEGKWGGANQQLPADPRPLTLSDFMTGSSLDAFEQRYYEGLTGEDAALPESFPFDCRNFHRPVLHDRPPEDVRELCYVGRLFDAIRLDPGVWPLVKRNLTVQPTDGLNPMTTTAEILAALPTEPNQEHLVSGGNTSCGAAGPDACDTFVEMLKFGQTADLGAAPKTMTEFVTASQNAWVAEGNPPPNVDAQTQQSIQSNMLGYALLKVKSNVFTIIGSGCMDYGAAEASETGEAAPPSYFKDNPVHKEIRATFTANQGALKPLSWKVQ